MREVTFKLKKGTEFPEVFAGLEARYSVPETMAELRERFAAEVTDVDAAIVAGFNGQGYSLGIQKKIKDALNSKAVGERLAAKEDPAAIVADVAAKVSAEKIGAPRVKGEGKKDKVAKAEAKAEAATNAARDMYLKMSAAQRKQFRPMLLAQGTFTEEELNSMDAEAGK